jgi:hypothetical protein
MSPIQPVQFVTPQSDCTPSACPGKWEERGNRRAVSKDEVKKSFPFGSLKKINLRNKPSQW